MDSSSSYLATHEAGVFISELTTLTRSCVFSWKQTKLQPLRCFSLHFAALESILVVGDKLLDDNQ